MSVIVVDYYSDKYYSGNTGLWSGQQVKIAQSFTGKAGDLVFCKFLLSKRGSPTGNVVAKLYAVTGTYGINSRPTGAALATSDNVDITTLTGDFQDIIFNFTGAEQYTLVDGTKYCIALEYSGGNLDNCLLVGLDNNLDGSGHSGNRSFYISSWSHSTAYDFIFYVYASGTEPIELTDTVLSLPTPISLKTTKEINGFWGADMDVLPDNYIQTESYIDIKDIDYEQYVVKNLRKIKSGGKTYYKTTLYHNAIEELSAQTVDRMDRLDTVENIATDILDGSGWTLGNCDIDETVFIRTLKRTSMLEALTDLATNCGGELYYYSKDHIVDLVRRIGSETGLQLRYDKNCTEIIKEEDSTDLVTRIFPYDADNNTINTTVLDDCEDSDLWTASGGGTITEVSTLKKYKSLGLQINSSTLNETFIHDLGAGATVDLSGHTSLKFWIYSEVANAAGLTFGIGESAYTENTVDTGALSAMSWKEVTLDLSSVADASKNAIRYLGFKNLTNGAIEVVFDYIRAFHGDIYIDSDNASLYKVKKEYVYQHSSKPEKTVFETILYPTHDAYTTSAAPNSNFNSLVMGVWNSPVWNMFLKYDTAGIPQDAVIEEATLYITQYQGDGNLSAATTQLCATDWNENTITHNNRPAASGASFHTWDFRSNGTHNDGGDILTTLQNWHSGAVDNYGITIRTSSGRAEFYSKNVHVDTAKPYIKVKYSITTEVEPVIKAAALAYLNAHDEPKLLYKVKAVDLSKVIVDTWEDEEIGLGDTLRIYDSELGLNVDVRVVKITKDILNPTDIELELANKTYNISDSQAELAKKLSYAMPFDDNKTIITANAVQAGYIGADVNA